MTHILSIQSPDTYTPKTLKKALFTLQKGNTLLYPTDTVYGLGVDATNIEATKKLYTLKEREYTKPFSIAVSDIEMLKIYAKVDIRTEKIISTFLPGPLTLILPRTHKLPDEVVAGGNTIGIRIPEHPFILELIKQLGKPITTTSANKSSFPELTNVPEIINQLPEIDTAIDQGPLENHIPSTIVDLTGDKINILREGPISKKDIEAIL